MIRNPESLQLGSILVVKCNELEGGLPALLSFICGQTDKPCHIAVYTGYAEVITIKPSSIKRHSVTDYMNNDGVEIDIINIPEQHTFLTEVLARSEKYLTEPIYLKSELCFCRRILLPSLEKCGYHLNGKNIDGIASELRNVSDCTLKT